VRRQQTQLQPSGPATKMMLRAAAVLVVAQAAGQTWTGTLTSEGWSGGTCAGTPAYRPIFVALRATEKPSTTFRLAAGPTPLTRLPFLPRPPLRVQAACRFVVDWRQPAQAERGQPGQPPFRWLGGRESLKRRTRGVLERHGLRGGPPSATCYAPPPPRHGAEWRRVGASEV
jgi:hypothetical protein